MRDDSKGGRLTSTEDWSPEVLVVDDSATRRLRITSQLAERGCRLLTAGNGQEALDLLLGCRNLPDFVLSDVNMPEMDGVELVRRMSASTYLSSIPVTLYTCGREELLRLSGGLKGEALVFLRQAVDFSKALLALEAQIRTRRIQRRLAGLKARLGRPRDGEALETA